MNKVITDGLVLTPPPFADGLDVWSSGDGTPGSDTYDQSGNGVFVPADQDFSGCIEILKTQSVTKLRYMGETSILPGCYIRVTAKVKCVAGALPDVRIAGWAGTDGGDHLDGVTEVGPSVSITGYGDVVVVSAIIGTGQRTGVDMVWADANYGHIGLDLTGPNGGIVRVDDFVVEDITIAFLRDMLGIVDVRDYGAIGDGVTDDAPAFERADAAADGREVLITAGTYFLGESVTFQNRVRFEGTVTMAEEHRLVFQKNFDYPTYVDAFADEQEAFKRAFQALLNFSDHYALDLCGRRITLTEPIDMQRAVNNRTKFETRRYITNGQLEAVPGPAWDDDVVVAQASYVAANSVELFNVANIASIAVGSLVTGNGVGREVYVREVDIAGNKITLSQQLFDAEGTQEFTFTRFKYMLDFSGFTKISDLIFDRIEFRSNGYCSAIMLAPLGIIFQLNDCQFIRPKDRGITSIGDGCQGMIIDRCNFESHESDTTSQLRKSLCYNTNANDVKIRNCRAAHFRHFGIMNGRHSIIANNHFFQGDEAIQGVRLGGLILTAPNCTTTINGNYIDNCFIEWTDEHDATPSLSGYSFGGLTITGNIFMSIDSNPAHRWIVVKPYGPGHFIDGLNVQGNVFRTNSGTVERVEKIDTTYADLDFERMRNIIFEGNAFNGVDQPTRNPHIDVHSQVSVDATWVVDTQNHLPFGGHARTVDSVVPLFGPRNAANDVVFVNPYSYPSRGTNNDEFHVIWPEPVRGQVRYSVRMDNPA